MGESSMKEGKPLVENIKKEEEGKEALMIGEIGKLMIGEKERMKQREIELENKKWENTDKTNVKFKSKDQRKRQGRQKVNNPKKGQSSQRQFQNQRENKFSARHHQEGNKSINPK